LTLAAARLPRAAADTNDETSSMTTMRKIAGRLTPALLAAAGLLALAQPAAAAQDVHWDVAGTFLDGGRFSGAFNVDKFGVLFDWDLTTTDATDGSGFLGQEYKNGLSGATSGNSDAAIAVGYRFTDVFQLTFAHSLFTPFAHNHIVLTGAPGGSFECVGSFSCFNAGGGAVRLLAGGTARATSTVITGGGGSGGGGVVSVAPEPAAWALMIAGFAGTGVTLRRRRAVIQA
jgi:hypothetical protein